MLNISPDQLETLGTQRRESFVARVVSHLRAELPEAAAPYPDAQLEEAVRRGLQAAEQHGIRSEINQCLFVDVMLWVAWRKDAALRKIVQAVLADPELADENDRVQVLVGCALRTERGAVHA